MARLMLSDEHWSKLRTIMREQGIYNKPNLRKTVEGILYRMHVGCPWRDLPKTFGRWNSIFQKFNRWSLKGKLMYVFKALVQEPDLEWAFIDGSIVKAHQHSAGAASEENQAIGKSRGGNTTKIHMAVDAHGLPIDFEITGGEVHDCKVAPEFIEKLPVADKGYDSEEVRNAIRKKSSIPVIPRKSNSKIGNADMDWGLYKYRHLVENLFARIKHFRGLATRFDKLKRNYRSVVAMVCALLWLPM
ncbi:MAG: IS5 family transposase ISPa67 [Legionella sp.]|uniref:IS5 family transposase n=1 Tax=Legionella sp. TaxID=459 RepID=UPI003D0FF703